MRKYTIKKGYMLFDQIYLSKEIAYRVEEENGIHKDEVKEGYYIFEVAEVEGLSNNEIINIPCNYARFFDTKEEALEDAIEEELELLPEVDQ